MAIFLLCLKFILPNLSQHRDLAESALSDLLQAQVRISSIDGRWDGWRPVVDIDGLSIEKFSDDKQVSIAVLDATFSFDPSQSLRVLQPVFNQMDLRGLTVRHSLVETQEKQKENDASMSGGSGSQLFSWLLHQSSVRIIDARFELETPLGEKVSISPVHLWLQQDAEMHQVQVKAQLKTSQGEVNTRFVAEVDGDPSKNPAQFYLNIEGLDHEILNPWLNLFDIQLKKFQASQEVWGELLDGKLQYISGKTQVDYLDFADYSFGQLALHTALMRRDRSYQLQVTDILLGESEKELNLPRISLDLQRNEKTYQPYQLMIDKVDLANVKKWLAAQSFIPADLLDIVNTMQPVGELDNVLVHWAKGVELDEFELSADLNNVSISAWDDVPELTGINGLLLADKESGQIHLKSQNFGMFYPTLFEHRWKYSDALGVIGWRFEDKGVVVASQLLHLMGEHVSADGRFSVYLPFSQDEQPLLNLQIGMQNSDGLQAQYYIPPEEVGTDTYQWLVKAIKGGQVKRAGFVLNGVTRSRLDDYQSPAVQMFFDVNQASFEYDAEWPAIHKAQTFVFFRNGELVVEAQGGKVYDSHVDYAWVHLPDTTDRLYVVGQATGQADTLQTLLSRTPLKKEVGNGLDGWTMQGELETLIDLEIPLYSPNTKPKVQVHSRVSEGRFSSDEERLDFTDIQGEVNFSSATGLYTEDLKGALFEQPVSARILSDKQQTQLLLDGSLETARLKRWLDLELLNVLRGKLSYQAQLDICPRPACNQLTIKSDLKGVEIAAPSPLAKTSSQSMALTLHSDLGGEGGKQTRFKLNLGNQLRGVMLQRGQDVLKGSFVLGGERASLPSEKGIWVSGELPSLDYDQLDQFLRQAGFLSASSAKTKEPMAQVSAANKLKEVSLQLGQFTLDDFQIDDLQVRLLPQPQGWLVKTQSEMLEGQLWLPDNSDIPYALRLDRLTLSKSNEPVVDGTVDDAVPKTDVQPKDLPLIDVDIQELNISGKHLGHWQLEVRPTEKGAKFQNIVGQLPGTTVNGEMSWEQNGSDLSDLTLKLDSNDFSQALSTWGLSEAVETKKLSAYLQLSWDRLPWDFDLSRADGVMQFNAQSGRLLDVGKSGNFLRVFGILNLNSLGRRLRLDFSDLLKSGVAFDKMTGDYKITKGIAATVEPFVMQGPSSNFVMTGKLDLVNETVDKDIEVALPVTGNIPLVSVLLGAPQVAGAVFLFDKLIGDPLEKFTKVKYHLKGDWSEPSIDLYEEEKKKSDQDQNSNYIGEEHG